MITTTASGEGKVFSDVCKKGDDFVTVVAVDPVEPIVDEPFVTILSIGDDEPTTWDHDSEEVLVFRLPGERLGFGLKFDGGSNATEKVTKLMIQSCATDSPASRTTVSWGHFASGDEILEIDDVAVTKMTRMECVNRLKESNVQLKLRVRKGDANNVRGSNANKQNRNPVPPPVPPRKYPRRNSKNGGVNRATVPPLIVRPPDAFTDKHAEASVHPAAKIRAPEPQVYTDLVGQEAGSLGNHESESDETGSSMSTVVEKHISASTTSNSSFSDARSITSTEVEPPSPDNARKSRKFDLDRVLEPFLELEREFSSCAIIKDDDLFQKLVAAASMKEGLSAETSDSLVMLEPPDIFQDDRSYQSTTDDLNNNLIKRDEDVSRAKGIVRCEVAEEPPKPLPRKEIPCKTYTKYGKKRPPPPPPPTLVNDKSNRCPTPNHQATDHHESSDSDISVDRLPRLIDFVPKDRMDVVIPSAVHPNPMDLLLERSFPLFEERSRTKMKPLPAMSSSVNLNLPNSPPAFSRMPPDGHEFPQNYQEVDPNVDLYELHSPATIKSPLYSDAYCTRKTAPPSPPLPAPYTDVPHEAKLQDVGRKFTDATHFIKPYPYQHDSSSKRHSQSWRNDERSERSVKDKIAMFSSAISKATPAFPRGGVRSKRDVVDHRGPLKAFSKSSFAVNTIAGGGSCPKTNEPSSYCLRDPVDSTNCCPSAHINRTQSSIDLTLFSSSCLSAYPSRSPDTSLSPMSSPSYTIGSSSTLPRKHKSHVTNGDGRDVACDSGAHDNKHAALSRTTSFNATSTAPLHSRSQSLVDVLRVPLADRTGDEQRKDSLTTLIEQRRRTMSKLRGLVIPERSVDEDACLKPIVDLPEIKSKEVLLNSSASSLRCRDNVAPLKNTKTEVTTSYVDCSWRSVLNAVDIPKYSPAFKRKTLTVYGVFSSASSLSSSLNSSREELRDTARKSPPAKPPRACNTQLAYGPAAYKSIFGGGGVGQQQQPSPPAESRDGHDSQITTTTTTTNNNNNDYRISRNEISKLQEDSDNDSAVSSSRSSLCQEYSPPSSPSPNAVEYDSSANDRVSNGSPSQSSSRTLRRTLSSETNVSLMSAASTLTSGSQASCSSNGEAYKEPGKRVLKAESVEAINRKNVLSSARYSCGQDFKVGSPLIKDVYDGLARFGDGFGDANCDEEREWFEYEKYDKDASLSGMKMAYLEIQDGDESDYSVKGSSSADTDEALDKSLDSTDSICGNYKSDFAMEKPAKDADVTSEVFSMERVKMTNGVEGVGKGKSDDDDDVDSHVSSGSSDAPKKSVGDIKKTFEKCERVIADKQTTQLQNHLRMSSTDSTTSEESFPVVAGHILNTNLLKEQQFGSITSLASSTSLISQQELQQLIDDANQTLEETAGGGEHDLMVIILHRDTVTSSIGITLAGGADYEAKEITVHKVLVGSPADKDGRIQKGDRILSINGRNMKGVTHREALSILKAPRPEVVLVVSRWKTGGLGRNTTMVEDPLVATFKNTLRPPRIPEVTQDCDTENVTNSTINNVSDKTTKGPITTITLVKEGGGLGFSLEGGKDSPLGDLPLTIKKIFTGGCAAKSGLLTAGDELISLNGVDVSAMSRTEAWSMMKRLSDGQIVLNIRRSLK